MSLPKADEWTDPGSMDPAPRRGRTCLVVTAVGLMAVVGSILIWRATSLVGLPDLGEPFDLKTRGTVAIPDDENAFTYYRLAVSKLSGRPTTTSGVRYLNWAQISEHDRDWYQSNLDAIDVWITGTTKDQALFIQPRDQIVDTGSLEVVQELGTMIQLAQLAGLRMEAQGDLEEAWTYYRAALRSSRHCGMHGALIERLRGLSMYLAMTDFVRSWAVRPNLNRDLLQAAFDDVIAIDAMTPPLRENLEADYFAFARLLDERDLTTWKVQTVMDGMTRSAAPSLKERAGEAFWRIAQREPERSRRVLRRVWVNWLAVADLPASERSRRQRDLSTGIYFDPRAEAPAAARMLTPSDLNSWVGSTMYMRLIVPETKSFETALTRERIARASLIVHLAECLYKHDQGEWPKSTQQLVGPYLKALPEGYVPAPGKP